MSGTYFSTRLTLRNHKNKEVKTLDLCMQYLNEAESLANSIQSVSLFESVFVEGSEETEKKNNEQGTKSFNLIRKAIDFIKGIFRKIKTVIGDFIDYFTLKGDEKNEFEKFSEECAKNPEFANKKITVANWREMNAEYEKVLTKMEKEARKYAKSEDEMSPNMLKEFQNKLLTFGGDAIKIGGKGVINLTVKEVINLCKQSKESAQTIKNLMDFDSETINCIEKALNDAERKKLYKKVSKLSSDCKLVRLIGGARKKKADADTTFMKDARKALFEAYKDCKKKGTISSDTVDAVNATKKFVTSTAVNAGKQAVKDSISDRREKRRLQREEKKLKKKNDKEELKD